MDRRETTRIVPAMDDEDLMTDLQELDFYLGGLPENINQWTNGKFQKGFSGCIHHIDTEN